MNWGALVLVGVGGAIIVIGVKGSGQGVCQSITGSQCAWLAPAPGSSSNKPSTPSKPPLGGQQGNPPLPPGALPTDVATQNCLGNPGCAPFVVAAVNDATQFGIDATEFTRQISQESGWNPNAKSPAGAEGIAQFMPGTAASLGVNPYNPQQALSGAAKLMSTYIQRYGGDPIQNLDPALAAYNAGPGTVDAAIAKTKYPGAPSWCTMLPAETQNYIQSITGSACY